MSYHCWSEFNNTSFFEEFSIALTLTKTANPTTYNEVGEVITYTYTVTNVGTVELNNIIIIDNKIDNISPIIGPIFPNQQKSTIGFYTITQTDIDNGFVTNHATGTDSTYGVSVNTGYTIYKDTNLILPGITGGIYIYGYNTLDYLLMGGGGGGGGGENVDDAGGGGGRGKLVIGTVNVNDGDFLEYSIGQGGSGGLGGSDDQTAIKGEKGGDTNITINSLLINNAIGGEGGDPGDIEFNGGNGGNDGGGGGQSLVIGGAIGEGGLGGAAGQGDPGLQGGGTNNPTFYFGGNGGNGVSSILFSGMSGLGGTGGTGNDGNISDTYGGGGGGGAGGLGAIGIKADDGQKGETEGGFGGFGGFGYGAGGGGGGAGTWITDSVRLGGRGGNGAPGIISIQLYNT